jgi:hypothetical protein
MAPFKCACGLQTRQPFYVNGEMMCAVCTERAAPRLVYQRTVKDWAQFQNESRTVPRRPRWASYE